MSEISLTSGNHVYLNLKRENFYLGVRTIFDTDFGFQIKNIPIND
jgi:hypothetical protein